MVAVFAVEFPFEPQVGDRVYNDLFRRWLPPSRHSEIEQLLPLTMVVAEREWVEFDHVPGSTLHSRDIVLGVSLREVPD
jgi:hypothetical protein